MSHYERHTNEWKTCAVCGNPFERRYAEGRPSFARRQTCGKVCKVIRQRAASKEQNVIARLAAAVPETLTQKCAWCGAEFSRRSNEARTRFMARSYCSLECSATANAARRDMAAVGSMRNNGMGIVHDTNPLCECGATATQIVYIVQINSNGYPYNSTLNVCAACAPLVEDAHQEPQTFDGTRCFGWQDGEREYHYPAINPRAHYNG